MSAVAPGPVRPTEGEMLSALHGLHGVFTVLGWICHGDLDNIVGHDERAEARDALIVAGEMLANELCKRS